MLSSNRIRGPTRFRKALNLIFPKLSLQNMHGFHHATILIPSFHGGGKERLAQWPSISDPKTTKMLGGTSRKIGWGCGARFLKPLPYFWPKSVIFRTLWSLSDSWQTPYLCFCGLEGAQHSVAFLSFWSLPIKHRINLFCHNFWTNNNVLCTINDLPT